MISRYCQSALFLLCLLSHFASWANSLSRHPRALRFPLTMSSSSSKNEASQFKVLGVCGGIGSGKSSACKLLVSALGCLDHLGEFIVL